MVVDEDRKVLGRINVLVNNAGRGLLGALKEVTDAEARSLFDLNVCGLINVTRAVVPVPRAQGGQPRSARRPGQGRGPDLRGHLPGRNAHFLTRRTNRFVRDSPRS